MIERSGTILGVDLANIRNDLVDGLTGDEASSQLLKKLESSGKILQAFLARQPNQRASRNHLIRVPTLFSQVDLSAPRKHGGGTPFVVLFLAGFSPTRGGIIAQHQQNKEPRGMRLKLVIIASVLAAVVGAGASIALVLGVLSVKSLSSPGLLALLTLLLPIAAIVFASIFVYRHTARRR